VVPRSVWQTDSVRTRHRLHPCALGIQAVFVHHTDSGNRYSRRDVPRMIQSFYDDHIEGRDWDDIGYNFLVDRMGNVYEGRAGGIDNAVIGAHTVGFNVGTVGIAAIGSFGPGVDVPAPLLESIARIAAWKLGRYGVDARARTVLISTNNQARYRAGEHAVFRTVSGHRDGYQTICPGDALYRALPAIRRRAFQLQRRRAGLGAPGLPMAP
jgi:N-acetylmuramoyl-L-alanine amidase